MLPRGLTSRIVLAFAGLSAAMLVAVAVTLFLVLHQLHQNEIEDTLSRQLVQVVVNLSREPVAQWDATLQDAGGPIADDGVAAKFGGMLQHQLKCVGAGLLAQVRQQRNVAAEDRLQTRADGAENRARTHYNSPHYP